MASGDCSSVPAVEWEPDKWRTRVSKMAKTTGSWQWWFSVVALDTLHPYTCGAQDCIPQALCDLNTFSDSSLGKETTHCSDLPS